MDLMQLKELCSENDLSYSGSKQQLVQRAFTGCGWFVRVSG
eukprot:COSAG01_NODE_2866_length_6949_cov_4.994599_11_plen_41_part_00